MTPRDCIIGTLGNGPAGAASLACALHNHCGLTFENGHAYKVLFAELKTLIADGSVEANESLCFYRLTNKLCAENIGKDEES